MSFSPPTDEERNAVQALKSRLESEEFDIPPEKYREITILRFYRGMKCNSDKALKRLVENHKWRTENKADDIEQNTHLFQNEIDKKKIVNGFVDLDGRPVSYCFAHRHIARDRKLEEMQMLTIWSLESTLKQSNPDQERMVLCFYLGKFTLACMDYEVVKYFIDTLQTNYPETLEQMLLIDAPFIFAACWAVIKRWIDPVTVEKVKFIRSDELSQHLPPESIPTFD